jgi:hypothetical protein
MVNGKWLMVNGYGYGLWFMVIVCGYAYGYGLWLGFVVIHFPSIRIDCSFYHIMPPRDDMAVSAYRGGGTLSARTRGGGGDSDGATKMSGANAIPAELNLSIREPTACPAYARQYKTYPTNGLTFKDGSQIIIPIDTSAPSCFMNPNATWLQFDFKVTISVEPGTVSQMNTPYIIHEIDGGGNAIGGQNLVNVGDPVYTSHNQFYRLPSCGTMAFISDMQIVVQGCPIEEIHRYNICATYLHDMAGIPDCKDPSAMHMYFANGKPFVAVADTWLDCSAEYDDATGENQRNQHTGKPINSSKLNEMRIGCTYRAYVPLISGILGTMARRYFPSCLVAQSTMTLELTIASANNACVASSPAGGTALLPAGETGYYYPSQQQYIGYVRADNTAGAVNDAIRAANTTTGMRKWAVASTRNQTLAVEITNVQLVLSQVILPDVISVAVISNAAQSDISVMTTSIHSYSTELDSKTGNAETQPQSVLIPMSIKVASANALLIGFREQSQLSDCRTDYFGRIAIGMQQDGSGANVQLKVGNEVIPYAPISTPQELYHHLARAMHEFGDKEYATMFMKCDDGRYATNETLTASVESTTDFMYKHTDFSHPLLQYPMPGCITYQSKRLPGSTDAARTMTNQTIIPWRAWMGTNRAFPNREPYFYSTCLVGLILMHLKAPIEEYGRADTLETTASSFRLTTPSSIILICRMLPDQST